MSAIAKQMLTEVGPVQLVFVLYQKQQVTLEMLGDKMMLQALECRKPSLQPSWIKAGLADVAQQKA